MEPAQLADRAYFAENGRQRAIAADKIDDESVQDRLVEQKMARLTPPKFKCDAPAEATTTFHGLQEFDYKSQLWTFRLAGFGFNSCGWWSGNWRLQMSSATEMCQSIYRSQLRSTSHTTLPHHLTLTVIGILRL